MAMSMITVVSQGHQPTCSDRQA